MASVAQPYSFQDRVPLEIWRYVLAHLPKYDLVSCLKVSRLYHRVAQQLLLSTITLVFAEDLRRNRGKRLTAQTWQILDHIISNTCFASIIRTVRVITLTPVIPTFELSVLVKAIKLLPHIRSFQWEYAGYGPMDAKQVSSCVSVLPESITELSVPSQYAELEVASKMKFHGLNQLSITSDARHIDSLVINYHLHPKVPAYFNADLSSLQELALQSTQLVELPEEVISRLTKLVVFDHGKADGIPMYLHHGHRLQTLELYKIWDSQTINFLSETPSALPLLQRLRLIFDHADHYPLPYFEVLGQLLNDRKSSLTALDISISTDSWDGFPILLPELDGVEVLGLQIFGFTPNTQGQKRFHILTRYLPRTVKALRLTFICDPEVFYHLITFIGGCPNLEFLHLNSPHPPRNRFKIQEFLHLTHLKMVILDSDIWEFRPSSDGFMRLCLWPPWKHRFCSPLNFPNDGAAWLMESLPQISSNLFSDQIEMP